MNPDVKHNSCSCVEEKQKITEGRFHKEEKTQEQRKAELKDKMNKMEKQLNEIAVSAFPNEKVYD